MPIKVPWMNGVHPALVTPFARRTELVDEGAYRRLVRHCLPHVDGLVTSGTTGEFHTLTRQEQKRLIEIAVEEAAGRPVIAGCGASGTAQAIALAEDAKAAGAKGVTWFGFYQGYTGDARHWPDMARIGRELRSVEDIVLAPYAEEEVSLDPPDAPLEVLVKRSAGKLHLVAVNYEDRDIDKVRLLFPRKIASAAERLTAATLATTDRSLVLSFAAYEPKVLDVADAELR